MKKGNVNSILLSQMHCKPIIIQFIVKSSQVKSFLYKPCSLRVDSIDNVEGH